MVSVNLDEVTVGLLVNAVSAVGRWLGTAAAVAQSGHGRRAEDLAIARWFETYELTSHLPPETSSMPSEAVARLVGLLRGDDVQAAVQELLAVRLTDGSEADAARVRETFVLTLAGGDDPEVSRYAEALASYYDDEISDLVGRLGDSPVLGQIRSEALSARIIAVLHAIERHTAALSSRPGLQTEGDFLTRYRAHVLSQHGKLEPPDFERRRRVPIAEIYVPTVIYEEIPPERAGAFAHAEPSSMTVWDLAASLDRSVLLGDPGGGKTTAATVLMHHFASDASRRIPLLVTLRNFAAEDPPVHSIAGFIENELSTYYQCPAPPGVVDLLLLTGRALVIFDGLDELLDASRRADMAARVEQFGIEYPLTQILVTSRVVGYDQARLDPSQFTTYRLGGFRAEDVAEYARKWFALDVGAHSIDADAFVAESESVPDLRTNPLLLSLMCILYRGEGSFPRNRAEVYEQCANLLFRRWDARRRLHQDLRVGHLVEPALRHLAWWLLTGGNAQAAVTERELIAEATGLLHDTGFESLDDALGAAREFVEFSRGRMWVFSDAGATPAGEKLYSFTHRTFLEYFAAAHLAYDSDTPEELAETLASRISRGLWEVVGELAIQIKGNTSSEGVKRIYEYLLTERAHRWVEGRSNILQLLARTLRSVEPPPRVSRRLAQETMNFMFSGDPDEHVYFLPLVWLLASCDTTLHMMGEEVTAAIARMARYGSHESRLNAYRLAFSLNIPLQNSDRIGGPSLSGNSRAVQFWGELSWRLIDEYSDGVIAAAESHPELRIVAINSGLLPIRQALVMPGNLGRLLQSQRMKVFGFSESSMLMSNAFDVATDARNDRSRQNMVAVGEYLIDHPTTPWVEVTADPLSYLSSIYNTQAAAQSGDPGPIAYLGCIAVLLASAESEGPAASVFFTGADTVYPLISVLSDYFLIRINVRPTEPLPDLPVPENFKQVFKDWAENKVNFTSPPKLTSDTK